MFLRPQMFLSPGAEAHNELVMSNDEIAAALSNDAADDTSELENEVDPALEASEEDFPSTWEDELGDGEEAADQDGETPARGAQVRQIKADGRVHEVNMADRAAVDRLLALGLGAPRAFTEVDRLRKTVGTKDKQLATVTQERDKLKATWDKLEAAKNNKAALYEQIFGSKWEEDVSKWKAEKDAYDSASPEERRVMDMAKKLDADRLAWEARQRESQTAEQRATEKAHQAEVKETRAMLLPEFYAHEFSNKVADPVLAEQKNAALWSLALRNLKQLGDVKDLAPQQIRKAFKDAAALLADNKAEVKKEVKKVIDDKKKQAATAARTAATRNYKTDKDSKADLATAARDPVKLFRKMFR